MNFLDLQQDLFTLIGDTRTEWLPDEAGDDVNGKSLKLAVIHGIKQTFDRLKQNSLYKEQNYTELEIAIVDSKCDIPADFEIEFEILEDDVEILDYNIQKKQGKILFTNTSITKITLRYLIKETTLSLITDEPNILEHFRESIANFGIEKYHQAQFDWDNIAKSVAYAEEKHEDLISKYY